MEPVSGEHPTSDLVSLTMADEITKVKLEAIAGDIAEIKASLKALNGTIQTHDRILAAHDTWIKIFGSVTILALVIDVLLRLGTH